MLIDFPECDSEPEEKYKSFSRMIWITLQGKITPVIYTNDKDMIKLIALYSKKSGEELKITYFGEEVDSVNEILEKYEAASKNVEQDVLNLLKEKEII